jgi:eukaryotic-like serine/threonine-protein kinase
MSLCINPNCTNSSNLELQLFCSSCNSELLLDGQYRVQALLGEGGFAKTYEVYDFNGDIKVLKLLTRKEPKAIELFHREARVLSQLRHPGIPKVLPNAYFTYRPEGAAEPLHCLVMEKILGLDLKHYVLRRRKAVEQKIVFQWLKQLVDILKTIHAQHILHRDIKPSNIMLRTDGHLVLIDFGTVRSDTDMSSLYTRVMSELYTPDEQLRGQAVPQSDFFALGRTAVFLLTAQDLKALYDPNTNELRWQHQVQDLAPEFGDLLERLMAPFPSQRPATADLLMQQLQQIESSIGGSSLLRTSGNPPQDSAPPPGSKPVPLPEETISRKNVVQSSPTGGSTLSSSFMERCQQSLAEFIGPIAPILCARTLDQHPQVSEREFVDLLCAQLPHPEDADRFKKVLFP